MSECERELTVICLGWGSMRLTKSFLVCYFPPFVTVSLLSFSVAQNKILLISLPPSLTRPFLLDGYLIHLTSWKDKYSLVECEAPASSLTQTRDEGKVSLSRAQTPQTP